MMDISMQRHGSYYHKVADEQETIGCRRFMEGVQCR